MSKPGADPSSGISLGDALRHQWFDQPIALLVNAQLTHHNAFSWLTHIPDPLIADLAGDGTTTATLLAQAIVKEGSKAVAAGMNLMDLKRGVDLAVGCLRCAGRLTHFFR